MPKPYTNNFNQSFNDINSTNQFNKKLRALKKYCPQAYKYLLFEYQKEVKDGTYEEELQRRVNQMINDAIKRKKKLDKLLKITNISDKKLEKLDYKGKQQYFKAKSKLCTVVFTSRDKDGNGITYRKPKEVKNNG